MKINLLGNTGLQVSEIGFGVLPMGKTQYNLSIEEGAKLIRYGLEMGINFLDTAQYYETYPYIRKALEPKDYHPVIVSKCLSPSYNDMEEAINQCLEQLDIDFVHVFLLHEVRGQDDFEIRSGAWRCLKEAKASGLVKAIGVSTHHVDTTLAMADNPDCDVIFPLINKFSLGIRNGENPGTKEDMEAAIKKNLQSGKGVFAMKVFGGGNLTGHYMECMDYVSSIEGISSKVIGFSNLEEIQTAVSYANGTLAKDYAPEISKKRIHIDQGDCEGCGACIQRCPNGAIHWNEEALAQVDHKVCLTCGYCAPVCPVRAIIMY